MSTPRPRFCKPSGGDQEKITRHLYVCGLGSALGSSVEAIQGVFAPFGELDHSQGCAVEMVDNKRFCFVSFVDEVGAAAAHDSLKDKGIEGSSLSVSKLLIKFAEESRAKSSSIPEPEDTVLSDDIIIPGLHVVEDFITEEEEARYLNFFDGEGAVWEEGLSRRVQHYGFPFNYRTLMLDYNREVEPIPDSCRDLKVRMTKQHALLEGTVTGDMGGEDEDKNGEELEHEPLPLSQLTVNEYEPGQGIASHIDTFNCFGPEIFIINMGSGITMALQVRYTLVTSKLLNLLFHL